MTVLGLNSRGSGLEYDTSADGKHFYNFKMRGNLVAVVMVDPDFKIHAAAPDGSQAVVLDAEAQPIWDSSLNGGQGGQRPAGWSVASVVWPRRGELLFDLHLGHLVGETHVEAAAVAVPVDFDNGDDEDDELDDDGEA